MTNHYCRATRNTCSAATNYRHVIVDKSGHFVERSTYNTSKCETVSSAWTVQKQPGNLTSPLMENECSAIPSWFCSVSGTTSRSPLDSMCESAANQCPAASTYSGLWEAIPGDGTLRTVVMSTSRSCIACLNMQSLSGTLVISNHHQQTERIQLKSARSVTGLIRSLLQLKQSSQSPSIPLFQCVSKPSPS